MYCSTVGTQNRKPTQGTAIHPPALLHTAYLFQHIFHYPATMEYTILPYTSTLLDSTLLRTTLQWPDFLRALSYLAAGACRYVDVSRSHVSLYLVELFERGDCSR